MVTSHAWSMETRWKGRIQRLHVITVLFRPAPSCRCINPKYHRPFVFLFFFLWLTLLTVRVQHAEISPFRTLIHALEERVGLSFCLLFAPIIVVVCLMQAGRSGHATPWKPARHSAREVHKVNVMMILYVHPPCPIEVRYQPDIPTSSIYMQYFKSYIYIYI